MAGGEKGSSPKFCRTFPVENEVSEDPKERDEGQDIMAIARYDVSNWEDRDSEQFQRTATHTFIVKAPERPNLRYLGDGVSVVSTKISVAVGGQ